MARRLRPEQRRAEILERTRAMIREQGPDNLNLRAVARWCGMSTPGLMHHFPTLKELLEELLHARYEELIDEFEAAMPPDPTLQDWADAVVNVSMLRRVENSRFDALETQAVANPSHPAHDYYMSTDLGRAEQTMIELAAKDYPRNPEAVVRTLLTIVDGLRLQWLRNAQLPDYRDGWNAIADTVFAGFEQYRA